MTYAVQVIRPFGFNRVGAVIYPTAAVRDEMLRRGLVAPVEDDKALAVAVGRATDGAAVRAKRQGRLPLPGARRDG